LSTWFLVTSLLYVIFGFLSWLQVFHIYTYDTWIRLFHLKTRYLQRLMRGLVKTAEETARGLGSAIDGRALLWTFGSLDEDHELERFFAAIPGFCSSIVVADPVGSFIKPNDKELSAALIGFMERTLSSNLISESVRQRRIVICRMAVDATSLSASQQIMDRVLLGTWDKQLYSLDFGLSAKRWGNINNPRITFRARSVVALVLSRAQERDERWFSLAIDQFGVSRSVIQQYLLHGESVLLANLIVISREIFLFHSRNGDWPFFYGVSIRTLEATSRFDAKRTLPELQHGFCDLWNRLVLTAQNGKDRHTSLTTARMLKRIRKVYIALHDETGAMKATLSISTNDDDPILNQVSSYPLCNAHGHVSTLASLDLAHHFPEAATHPTEFTDSPATSPVLAQAPQSALLAFAAATISHSPSATGSLSIPLALSHGIFPASDSPVACELPSPSDLAPTPGGMHHTSLHTHPDSAAIPSSSVHFGSASISPTAISHHSVLQISPVPGHAIIAKTTDPPALDEAVSGSDQPRS
jgi:hypothetical protein